MSRPPKTYSRQTKPRREERERKRERRDQEEELKSLRRQVARLEKKLSQSMAVMPDESVEVQAVDVSEKTKPSPRRCPNCATAGVTIFVAPHGTIWICKACDSKGKLNA